MAGRATAQLRLRKAERHDCTKNKRETAEELRNRQTDGTGTEPCPLRAAGAPLSLSRCLDPGRNDTPHATSESRAKP